MRRGEPLTLHVNIRGAASTERWFIAPGPVLEAYVRARKLYTGSPGDHLWMSAASYSLNDPLYARLYRELGELLVYMPRIDGVPTLVYHALLYARTDRPQLGSVNGVGEKAYVISTVLSPFLQSAHGRQAISAWHASISETVAATTKISVLDPATDLTVIRLGKGSLGIDGALETSSLLAGFVSMLLRGASAQLFGVYSLLAAIPSTFFYKEHLASQGRYAGPNAVSVWGEWRAGYSFITRLGLVAQASNIAPLGSPWNGGVKLYYGISVALESMDALYNTRWTYLGNLAGIPEVPPISLR